MAGKRKPTESNEIIDDGRFCLSFPNTKLKNICLEIFNYYTCINLCFLYFFTACKFPYILKLGTDIYV